MLIFKLTLLSLNQTNEFWIRYYNTLHIPLVYFGRHLSSVSLFACALEFEIFKSIISNALLLRPYKSKYW